MPKSIKVGVIADTHGFLNSEVFTVFSDVDHILHAGDIGAEDVLEELRAIAPVTAVQGNGDYFPGWERYRLVEILHLNGKTLLLTHEAGAPFQLAQPMREVITANRPHAVVYGHTHYPSIFKRAGVLYFNPGLGGRASHSGRASVGILYIGDAVEAEIIPLAEDKFYP